MAVRSKANEGGGLEASSCQYVKVIEAPRFSPQITPGRRVSSDLQNWGNKRQVGPVRLCWCPDVAKVKCKSKFFQCSFATCSSAALSLPPMIKSCGKNAKVCLGSRDSQHCVGTPIEGPNRSCSRQAGLLLIRQHRRRLWRAAEVRGSPDSPGSRAAGRVRLRGPPVQ